MPQKSQDKIILGSKRKKQFSQGDSKAVRADKLLSSLGLCSRRGVEEYIKKHKVTSDNMRIIEHGQRIPFKGIIKIDGREIRKPKKVYYLLNKPKGIVSTASDEFRRKNVVDLIKTDDRIFPIGRLDRNTHGLLILTNDGSLTNMLIHPKYHIGKVYILKIKGQVSSNQLEKLEKGIELADGMTAPAKVNVLQIRKDGTFLELTIYEGRKRQIRRMCEEIKLNLVDLERVRFGNIELGDLKTGEYRELTGKEVEKLRKLSTMI